MNTYQTPDPTGDPASEPGAPETLGWTGVLRSGTSGEPDAAQADDGRYERQAVLGRGGMGVVFRARDTRLDRTVALKESLRDGELAERLSREAAVTASLDHPGIVTVHDVGRTAAGRPFYTMRLLSGSPLGARIATDDDRGGLVRRYLDACNAIAYAHAQGVLHRDLKPDNIVIGAFGETQVVDWGLAVRLDDPAAARGGVVGTPAYMSPEQARGEPLGPPSDVWSLGAVLYTLWSRRPPRAGASSDEVLARAQRGERPDVDALDAPRELKAILERALADTPADRYPDAGALAADVAAWLDGRRVEAHRYTPWELLTRLVRAWRAPLIVAGLAGAGALALAAGWAWSLAAERDRVAAAELRTRAALVESDFHLASALVAEAQSALAEGAPAVAGVLAGHAVARADQPVARGVLAGVALTPRALRMEEVSLPGCGRVVVLANDDALCATRGTLTRVRRGSVVWRAEASDIRAEGHQVFIERDGTIFELDLETGLPTRGGLGTFGLAGTRGVVIDPAVWGPVTPTLLNDLAARLCPGSEPAGVAPWALPGADLTSTGDWAVLCADGKIGRAPVGATPARYVPTSATRDALSGMVTAQRTPDGQLVVVGGSKGALMAVDLDTGRSTQVTLDGPAWRLIVSPDGARVAAVGERGVVDVLALPALTPVVHMPVSAARDVRFEGPDDVWVAESDRMRRWHLPAVLMPTVLRGSDGVTSAMFSPDGERLAAGQGRFEAVIWDLATGSRLADLPTGNGTAKAVAWSPAGDTAWFVMVGTGETPWQPVGLSLDGHPRRALSDAAVGMPGRRLVVVGDALVVLGFLVAPPERVSGGHHAPVEGCPALEWYDAASSPNGRNHVLLGSGGRVVPLLDAPLRCGPGWTVPDAIAADVDDAGRIVVATPSAVGSYDADGVERWGAPFDHGRVFDVAVAADGRWIAAGGAEHTAWVWDREGNLRAILSGHEGRVASVDFHPDGRILATGSWDGSVRLWGMDVLDQPASELAADVEDRWGLTLQEALAAAGR
jgi:WD40 repeat protein/tRNA A-37 threonylcarbamoyl transferase component Bud32